MDNRIKKSYVFAMLLVALFAILNIVLIVNYMIRIGVAADKYNTTTAEIIGGMNWQYLNYEA